MYKPYRRQKSFYDAVYEANVPENHILKHLEKVINWGRFEWKLDEKISPNSYKKQENFSHTLFFAPTTNYATGS